MDILGTFVASSDSQIVEPGFISSSRSYIVNDVISSRRVAHRRDKID